MEADEPDTGLAVLEMALAEAVGGEAPPDLWPRLQAAQAVPEAVRMRPRSRPWLAAALLTIGVAVVGLVATLNRTAQPAGAPIDQREIENAADGPRTLEQAQARLVDLEQATVEAHAVRSAASGTWYSLDQHPLEDFFGKKPTPRDLGDLTRGDLIDVLRDALHAAAPLPAPHAGTVWTHSIQLRPTGSRLRLLVARAASGAMQFAFAGASGPIAFAAPAFPLPQLMPVFDEAMQLKIAARGFVLGDAGFAAIPTTAWRLRLCEVSAIGIGAITRFPACRQLDLTASPACHGAQALRQLANVPPRALIACASWLDADGFAAIASLGSLEELFLVGPDFSLATYADARTVAPAPHLDDAAVHALARLGGLTELALCGGSFGDRGLAALARLTKLKRLALPGCDRITPAGWHAFAGHGLTELDVRGCTPPTATGNGLASLPSLQKLRVGSAHTPTSLAAFAALPALTELMIDGRMAAAELAGIQHLPALRELSLRLVPPLGDADLGLLHGAAQLRKLSLSRERISEAGLAALRNALPKCSVSGELW